MAIKTIFKELGLSDKEAKIYLASLNLGTSSITDLSKKAGLKRPTAYLVIDNLLAKNLLIKIPQGKRTYYKPENPQVLIKDLEDKKQKISQIIPKLTSLYQQSSKQPKIRFYQGKDKIQKMSEEIWRAKEIWAMFSPDNFLKIFNEKDSQHLFRILIRHGGIIYDLLEDTKKARQFAQAKYRFGVSQVKFLPKSMKLSTDLLVSDNKVALISFANVSGVIIEDPSIAQMQKMMLQFIWNQLA